MAEPQYEAMENPANIQVGEHPKHKAVMAWRDGEHELHYHHGSLGFGTSPHNYTMHHEDTFVGTMGLDKDGRIQHIEVHPERRRQGLATKMLRMGNEIHEDIDSIPAPQHSDSRTEEGDAWAKAQGAEPAFERVHREDYRSARWTSLRDPDFPKLKSHLNEFHSKMIANGLDNKGMGDAKFHVDSAHDYLDTASNLGKKHSNYFDTMNNAHHHIEELGYIHEDHYGDMEHHEALMDHMDRMY